MSGKKSLSIMLSFVLLFTAAFVAVPGVNEVKAANLLTNPGFETGTTEGWSPFGSPVSISAVTDQAFEGSYSALVTGREEDWNGIGQNILGLVESGNTYDVSARVRLENAAEESINVTVKQVDSGGEETYYTAGTTLANDDRWVELNGSFTPEFTGELTELTLYFEGPEVGVNYYIDDVSLEERVPDAWKAEANERIEQIRKRDVSLQVTDENGNPLSGASVDVQQVKHHFAFGSALNRDVINNQQYAEFFKEHFEWAVFENAAKWYANEPSQGNVTYDDADQMYAFAEENDIIVRGHTIFWADEEYQPDWVTNLTGDALRQAVDDRLDSVVNHFKGKFVHWDVNNEMLHGTFFVDRLGESIRPYMFNRTREIDPDAKLFVNDYNIITSYSILPDYIAQIQELQSQGTPIDGIGVQGHFGETVDPVAVKNKLDQLAELNLPIWISEYDSETPDEYQRADNLENLYRVAFSHPAVEGILMWGFWEGNHWKGADAAIVNQDWTLNEAGRRYEQLMEEWTTNLSGETDSQGRFDFRGFHGTYEVTVNNAVTRTFELEPGDSAANWTIRVSPDDPGDPPGDFTLSATAGSGTVSLDWTSSSGASSYNVQRATSQGGPYTTVAEGLSETSFTDTGLSNGTTYYYVVTAENAAGSTNSNEVSATPQEQSTSADLVIEYRVGDTNPTDNQMKPQLRIVNEGTEDVSLSDLTVRYWFTNDSEKDMQYFCDWAAVGCSNINASIVDMSQPAAEADAYLELTFTSGAGTLGAGSHTGDIQNRLHYTDWSNFDENNDYSYNETQTQYAPADNIAIYQNGQLVWGTEPQ